MRVRRRYVKGTAELELELDGRRLIQREHDGGKTRVIDDRKHRDAELAVDVLARLHDLYTNRGYAFVGEEPLPPAPPAFAPATIAVHVEPGLEAECEASPDDAGPWEVYADWLIERGDPRGELAALVRAGATREAAVGHARDLRLLGDADLADYLELEARFGFVRAVTLYSDRHDDRDDRDLGAITRAALALPVLRFVTAVRFGLAARGDANTWRPAVEAVAAAPHAARLRSLRLDAYDDEHAQISWVPYGDLGGVWGAFPRLEELRIRSGGGGALGEVVLPSLRTFVRVSGGLAEDELAEIAVASWPRLEHLELWLGQVEYGGPSDASGLGPILVGAGLPQLRHLGLVNSELDVALVEALADAPILARLRSLDLSRGTLASAACEVLLARASRFAHLERVDVDDNFFSEDELARLRAAIPGLVGAEQREVEDGEDRYATLGE